MHLNLNNLIARAKLLKFIRAFFDERGFVEVETPVRIDAPAPDPYSECPPCGKSFLRASPELQMKKLLALGMEKIYQIGPCFRDGEKGSRHNPEFTMLEWYRANADYNDIAHDMELLISGIFKEFHGVELPTPFERISVRDIYVERAGWDPVESWDEARFDYDMATVIEPFLPQTPLFLIDYPAQAASLARLKKGDETVAERWELYLGGVEVANAFSELTNALEQRDRFVQARKKRLETGSCDYPIDEEFLQMLQSMPRSGGVALGIDRLVMAVTSASSIDEVRVLK